MQWTNLVSYNFRFTFVVELTSSRFNRALAAFILRTFALSKALSTAPSNLVCWSSLVRFSVSCLYFDCSSLNWLLSSVLFNYFFYIVLRHNKIINYLLLDKSNTKELDSFWSFFLNNQLKSYILSLFIVC